MKDSSLALSLLLLGTLALPQGSQANETLNPSETCPSISTQLTRGVSDPQESVCSVLAPEEVAPSGGEAAVHSNVGDVSALPAPSIFERVRTLVDQALNLTVTIPNPPSWLLLDPDVDHRSGTAPPSEHETSTPSAEEADAAAAAIGLARVEKLREDIQALFPNDPEVLAAVRLKAAEVIHLLSFGKDADADSRKQLAAVLRIVKAEHPAAGLLLEIFAKEVEASGGATLALGEYVALLKAVFVADHIALRAAWGLARLPQAWGMN